MLTRCLICSLALAAAWPSPAAARDVQPRDTESSLAAEAAARREAAVELLEEIVNINSGTLNFDGVRRVGQRLRAEFDRLGFDTRWLDGNAFGRAGHLIATRAGAGPRVLLIGHLDTVFEADSPFQRFERLGRDAARGPGITDMKGGNVVMLVALQALAATGVLDALDLTVILTGDEEDPGTPLELARAPLVEAARRTDVAIGFEDGDGDPSTAVIARRGSSSWNLEVSGQAAHSSQIFQPDVGAGAIYEAARILNGFYVALADEELLTFNPGVVLGGTMVDFDAGELRGTASGKQNVVARRVVVSGDLRTISPEQLLRSRERMREIVADHLPGTEARIVFSDGYPPMAPTRGNRQLLALLDEVSRDLGQGPVRAVDPRNAGAADVSFVAHEVAMVIDGVGLMGSGGHTIDETADLRTLVSQARRVALLLSRLAADSVPATD